MALTQKGPGVSFGTSFSEIQRRVAIPLVPSAAAKSRFLFCNGNNNDDSLSQLLPSAAGGQSMHWASVVAVFGRQISRYLPYGQGAVVHGAQSVAAEVFPR